MLIHVELYIKLNELG